MDRSCPRCGTPLAPTAAGDWACTNCGHTEVTFSSSPVTFRSRGRAKASAGAKPHVRRRGSGAAVAVAFLLMSGGLAAAAYVFYTQPEASSFLDFSPSVESDAGREPADMQVPVAVDGIFHREFAWRFQDRDYTWSMAITESTYDYFRGLDRPVRRQLEGGVWHVQPAYDMYVSNTDDDAFIDSLAAALLQKAHEEGFSDDEALSFALTFVQSLPYTRDEVTTRFDEYPRFPLETLVDNGGDCEDSSILYASLVKAMGYGTVLLSPPGHMAVGVAASEGFDGAMYLYEGQHFTYVETTGDGYGIGRVPAEYQGLDVTVYELTAKPLFDLEVDFGQVSRDGRQQVRLTVTQTGSATARDVQILASVDGSSRTYDSKECDLGDVQPGQVESCTVYLDLNRVPRGTRVSIRCIVQDGTYIYDEADSTPWVPRA